MMFVTNFFRSFLCLDHKFVIFHLVLRNLKLKYRRSLFGIVWSLLGPGLSGFVYYFVFKYVVKMDIENYLIFVLSGVLPWGFVTNSLTSGLETIVGNHTLFNKIPLRLNVFNLSENVTHFVNLLVSIPVLFFFSFVSDHSLSINAIYLLPILFMLFLLTYSMGFLLGVAFVYFRDLRHIMSIVLQVLFYLTPIVYKTDMIPEQFKMIVYLNPFGVFFDSIHQTYYYGNALSLSAFGIMASWSLFFVFVFYFVSTGISRRIVEDL